MCRFLFKNGIAESSKGNVITAQKIFMIDLIKNGRQQEVSDPAIRHIVLMVGTPSPTPPNPVILVVVFDPEALCAVMPTPKP